MLPASQAFVGGAISRIVPQSLTVSQASRTASYPGISRHDFCGATVCGAARTHAEPSQAIAAVVTTLCTGFFITRKHRARGERLVIRRKAEGFGPKPTEVLQKEDVSKNKVGSRLNYMVVQNREGIIKQLQQYGFSIIDGFLGALQGSRQTYADIIREEMKALFDRGWFESQTENNLKLGNLNFAKQDLEHRFRYELKSNQPGDEKLEKLVDMQYELAPTVVDFFRGITISLAEPIAKADGHAMSTQIAYCELTAAVGNGARWDRHVDQEGGVNTEYGFCPDSRKLTIMYFTNPNWRPELGGELVLEGVIYPGNTRTIEPLHDRLVMFWSDRTVYSVRPSQARTISEHRYDLRIRMTSSEPGDAIKYDLRHIAQFFPELQGQEIIEEPAPRPDDAIPDAGRL